MQDNRGQSHELAAAHARFLRGLSHELRTPLGSILILTELLEDGDLPAGQLDKVRKVRQAASDLRGQLEQVSVLAKAADGRLAPAFREIDMRELAEELEERASPRAHAKGLAFDLTWDQDLPETVCTDRDLLARTVNELLGHAIEATRQGGVTLSFARIGNPNPGEVMISVRDTGPGIPEALLPTVFEPFPEESFRTRRPYGGSALALPVAKALADLIGGRLTLRCEEGRGSVTSLTLPVEPPWTAYPKG